MDPLETDQYFKDYAEGCTSNDYDVADGQGVCGDRYHVRWEYAFVTSTGYTFAATPHRDTYDGAIPCGHCIAPGGFTSAQFAIFNNWVGSGDHPNYQVAWWGNNQIRLGCDGQPVSASGYVYYISLDGEQY